MTFIISNGLETYSWSRLGLGATLKRLGLVSVLGVNVSSPYLSLSPHKLNRRVNNNPTQNAGELYNLYFIVVIYDVICA